MSRSTKYHLQRTVILVSHRTNSWKKTRNRNCSPNRPLDYSSYVFSVPFPYGHSFQLFATEEFAEKWFEQRCTTCRVRDAHCQPVGRSSRKWEAAATVACRVLRNTERRVPLSCFTEVSCRTDGSRRWRIDFIQRCVSRCSMNAALEASTFVCHLTTPRFRSLRLPPNSYFSHFFSVFLFFFPLSSRWFSSLSPSLCPSIGNGSRRQRKSANYLSGMEFWELDSRYVFSFFFFKRIIAIENEAF